MSTTEGKTDQASKSPASVASCDLGAADLVTTRLRLGWFPYERWWPAREAHG